jgi:hypothetical protein
MNTGGATAANWRATDTNEAKSTEIVLSPAPELQPAALFTPTPKAARCVLEFFIEDVLLKALVTICMR